MTGFIFDHHESPIAATLSRKMADLVSNESALRSVAARGYKKAQAYNLPEVAARYFKDFECIVGRTLLN
jgi:hypothetical protein